MSPLDGHTGRGGPWLDPFTLVSKTLIVVRVALSTLLLFHAMDSGIRDHHQNLRIRVRQRVLDSVIHSK